MGDRWREKGVLYWDGDPIEANKPQQRWPSDVDYDVLDQRRLGIVGTLPQQYGVSCNTCGTNSKVDEMEENFTVPEHVR